MVAIKFTSASRVGPDPVQLVPYETMKSGHR